MIYKLVVKDVGQAICPWWGKVDWLKGKTEIEFGPGLNILYGPNGSGKSTVLTTIAKSLFCYDGDQQLMGQYTCTGLLDREGDLLRGVEVVHDGSPIMHFDPKQQVGMIEGGGAFDWDFSSRGLSSVMFKGSGGQTTMHRMDRALGTALGKVPWPEMVWKVAQSKYPLIAAYLKGDGKRVRPTLLLDEPTNSLDLKNERSFYRLLKVIADSGVQVIVATHSVFALHYEDANYINTKPDGVKEAAFEVEAHFLEIMMRNPALLEAMKGFVQDHPSPPIRPVTPIVQRFEVSEPNVPDPEPEAPKSKKSSARKSKGAT